MAPFGSCRLFTLYESFPFNIISTQSSHCLPFPHLYHQPEFSLFFFPFNQIICPHGYSFHCWFLTKPFFSVHSLLSIVPPVWFKIYFIGSCFHTRIKHDKKTSQVIKTEEIHKKMYFQKNLCLKTGPITFLWAFKRKDSGESWLLLWLLFVSAIYMFSHKVNYQVIF